MSTYAEFYTLSTGYIEGSIPPKFDKDHVKPIPACGSNGVAILDGRNSLATQRRIARDIAIKRGFVGFKIIKGDSLLNTRELTDYEHVEKEIAMENKYIIRSHGDLIKVLYGGEAKEILGDFYTPELVTIIKENSSYISEHNLCTRDIDIINKTRAAIEKRNLKVTGFSTLDNVEYISEFGKEYPRAVIDGDTYRNGKIVICEQGSVHVRVYKDKISHSISGGSFPVIDTDKLVPNGTIQKTFWTWGSCGARGNGGLYFKAEVKNWKLDDRMKGE